ncbi:MAG TPA: nucleotide exchange factor GrpE [Gemmatimonadaceae bacterium]|nr:nucleotide exchange factor GrpE [Gemmatimonadaceae bacterium]
MPFRQRETNIPDPADSDRQATANETAAVVGNLADLAESPAEDTASAVEMQKERYLRLAAEYDNYRKRTAKEVQQASARGQADLIRHLLTSLDDLSRFAHVDPATTDATALVKGVEMVEKNLLKVLADAGVEIINPLELPFDPNLHEAVSTMAAESPDEDHMVAQVYQAGYLLKGQLLRPARVVVKQY